MTLYKKDCDVFNKFWKIYYYDHTEREFVVKWKRARVIKGVLYVETLKPAPNAVRGDLKEVKDPISKKELNRRLRDDYYGGLQVYSNYLKYHGTCIVNNDFECGASVL